MDISVVLYVKFNDLFKNELLMHYAIYINMQYSVLYMPVYQCVQTMFHGWLWKAIEIWIAAGRQPPSGRTVGAVSLARDARVFNWVGVGTL